MNEKLQGHYKQLLDRYGDTHESAQYSSRESQEARYEILVEIADLDGCKILDFGCGTGHFASFLKDRGIDCSYYGVDIVEEFFVHARNKHPEHKFGFIDEFPGEEFDYAIVSGVFNNRVEDNDLFFRTSIADLFKKVKKGIAFNLMSTYVDFQDEQLWYIEPEKVFSFMKQLTPYIVLRNDYVVKSTPIPFEFVIYAYKHPVQAGL